MNKAKIIDTSYHKGYIDWNKIKEQGVEGVILKASDGYFMPDDMAGTTWTGHSDPTFLLYWKEIKDIFDWRGAYHFLRVDDEVATKNGRLTSQEQIYYFYDLVTGEGLEWNDYIVLDIEQSFSQTDYLARSVVAERVENAIALTEELFGRKPIIYTGAWWWEYYHQYFNKEFIYKYPFWLSHYWNIDSNNDMVYNGYYYYIKPNRLFPPEWLDRLEDRIAYCRLPVISDSPTINPEKVYLWQYSASGVFDGIASGSKIDINRYILNEEDWSEARGTDPGEPPVEPPEETTLECLIKIIGTFIHEVTNCLANK
jgi:GH25 family lysozyme M1 (1,4-beta-N-acetylmuramidase)